MRLLAVLALAGCYDPSVPRAADAGGSDAPSCVPAGAPQVSLGRRHTCVALAGQAHCFGDNGAGQLGTGDTTSSFTRRTVAVDDVVEVAAGNYHTCALQGEGTVRCWGANEHGQLGDGSLNASVTPVQVQGLGPVDHVVAGGAHTCALDGVGQVFCWGRQGASGVFFEQPMRVGLSAPAREVVAGHWHACALDESGDVHCWGSNIHGQCGVDGAAQPIVGQDMPVTVSLPEDAVSVAAGGRFSCAALASGAIWCWGYGGLGELGDGLQHGNAGPLVAAVTGERVVAGARHACALEGGILSCWGSGSRGQLGHGILADVASPMPLALSGIRDVFVGGHGGCVTDATDVLRCWGLDSYGQVGDGAGTNANRPALVETSVTSVSAGTRFTCRITDGVLRCGGWNTSGNIFYRFPPWVREPTVIPVTDPTQVSAGGYHACAVDAGSVVRCWGWNDFGQLGDGTTDQRPKTAVTATVPTAADQVRAGDRHTCALAGGQVWCWGSNEFGQVGAGTFGTTQAVPTQVLSGASRLSTGAWHTCAVADAAVQCWGRNDFQQLGTSGPSRVTPMAVPDLPAGPVDVSAGEFHTCAAFADGQVFCWGYGGHGQVGTLVGAAPPRMVPGVSALGVTAGSRMSCAWRAGTAWCWGDGTTGALGDGTFRSRSEAMPVLDLPQPIAELHAGYGHVCAIAGEGRSLYCWGDDSFAELGIDRRLETATPSVVSAPCP